MSAPGRSPLARLVAGEVDEQVRDLVLAHLRRARRPVPIPGLCNLLWFKRGPDGGHEGPAFDAYWQHPARVAHERPPTDKPTTPLYAVPLGAVVVVRIGSDEAYGEVAWREGAHPGLSDGWVPGWLAGAPLCLPLDGSVPARDALPPDQRVLRERVVLDFSCLGDALAPRQAALDRLVHRGRADRFGHFVAPFAYEPGLEEADEVTFWAVWTAARHAAALEQAGVPADPAALAEGASLLAGMLADEETVRSFGPYVVDEERYRQVVEADVADAGPISRVVRSLIRLPHHDQVAWAAMSQRLASEASLEEMAGLNWPLMVVAASLRTLEVLAEEAPDGDWDGVHLRLDDAWQGGGLWRTELIDEQGPILEDPALALGLGWAEHLGEPCARRKARDAESPGEPDGAPSSTGAGLAGADGAAGGSGSVVPGEGGEDGGDEEEDALAAAFDRSEVSWLVHLNNADLDKDRVRLPAAVRELVALTLEGRDQDRLIVELRHDGEAEQRAWCSPDERGDLSGLTWPLGAYAGTSVRCSWTLATTVLVCETRLLAEPEEVSGLWFTHEFNLAVALAALEGARRSDRTTALGQLIRAAVRRHGDLEEDGDLSLDLEEVVRFCFGPSGDVLPGYDHQVLVRAVRAAVGAMQITGRARLEGDRVIVASRRTTAGTEVDVGLLRRFAGEAAQRLRRAARRHTVSASVVHLSGGQRHSLEKAAAWADVAGTMGLPEVELGEHETWRVPHARGLVVPAEVAQEVERARAALERRGADGAVLAVLDTAVDPLAPDPATPDPFAPEEGGRRAPEPPEPGDPPRNHRE